MTTRDTSNRLSGWVYAALFFAFAGAILALPAARLEHLSSNPFQGLVSDLLKAWFLIGSGSLLVYFLLQRGEPVPDANRPLRLAGLPFLLLATAMLAITGVGLGLTVVHQLQTETERLNTAADFQLHRVLDVLHQHRADAEFIQATLSMLAESDLDPMATDRSRQRLVASLEVLARGRDFDAVSLFGSDNRRLWASRTGFEEIPPGLESAIAAARHGRSLKLAGPYAASQGRLDFIVAAGKAGQPATAIVLHLNLFRYLERLPATGIAHGTPWEIFVVRSADGAAQLVFPVQSGLNPAISPAAVADRIVRNRLPDDGLVAGNNSNGRPGVAAIRRIPDTDWILAVWQAQDDFYPRLMRDAYWIGFSGLLAVFTTAAGLALLRQKAKLVEAREVGNAQAERIRALSLLNAIADGSEDAIFAKDAEGRYLLFNRAAARYVGKPVTDILGRCDDSLFPPDLAAAMAAHDAKVIDTEANVTVEQTLDTALGRLTFLATKGPLRDDDGKLIGVFGISRDITGLKRDAAELRARNDELERFNRATVGRELDMISLKRRVNALTVELGRKPPYPLAFESQGNTDPETGAT